MKLISLMAYVAVSAVTGLLLAGNPIDPSVAPLPDDAKDAWSLPTEIDSQARKAAMKKLAKRFKTEDAVKTSGSRKKRRRGRTKKDPNALELRAVVFVGGLGHALIEHRKEVKSYTAGDRLPGGSSLVAVEATGIRVDDSGDIREMLLYKPRVR